MKQSLRRKYRLAGCILVLGFLLFSIFLNTVFKEPFVIRRNQKKMAYLAQTVITHIHEGNEMLQEKIEELSGNYNVRVGIVDESYGLLASTNFRENRKMELSPIVLRALKGAKNKLDKNGSCFVAGIYDSTGKIPYLIQMNKVDGVGYVTIRKSLVGLNDDVSAANMFYILSGVITLVLAVIMVSVWARKTVEPLEKMNQVTQKIAKMNFDESLEITSQDELGTLAESINSMSAQLEKNLNELQEGIQFRKNLVRNMAHELKTPITVIMGYVENLSYVAEKQPQKLEKYKAVITEEGSRMNRMIQEMLELSAYEKGENVLKLTEFSGEALMKEMRRCFDNDFGSLGLEYTQENTIAAPIHADYGMLCRGVYNFIKNAVQHSKEKGSIRVNFYEDGEYQYFSVFNTNSHIPQEELDKIWDVFYKVDKARSRERTSCGIGLSIVKEVAYAHHGGVRAENKEDGVLFTIYIKKMQGFQGRI